MGQSEAKLIMLYAPIGSFIRSTGRTSYADSLRGMNVSDFDVIGNLLVENTTTGLTFQQLWVAGRQQLLGALGTLGYRPPMTEGAVRKQQAKGAS